MCAKPAKKSANKPTPPPAPVAAPALVQATTGSGVSTAAVPPAWIDSTDPRRRLVGKVVLGGVWLYVAALWLLALDQTFHWGIFGPKVPLLP